MKLGKTGKFPDGKLNADDEGALTFKVGEDHGNVRIDFATPVAWLALPPEQAVALAQLLIVKARVVAKRTGKTLVVQI